ncbi:MAG: hypothetical protein JRE72_10020 [Deltaproteobacteria bacterium]|nr:hypothetical protein [Deltaproteobacteria bacterium]
MDKDEIYSMAASEIWVEILEEKREKLKKIEAFRVRIKARVYASNFIKAKMEETRLEKEEDSESYRKEIMQRLSAEMDPGKGILIKMVRMDTIPVNGSHNFLKNKILVVQYFLLALLNIRNSYIYSEQ